MNKTAADRDDLAAKYYPREWEKAQVPGKSKRRNQLRKWAEQMQIKEGLREQGACCGNCGSFGSVSLGGEIETICHADSDFYGYALTRASDLCHRWHAKKDP
jgi:hypothetical protein